MKGFHPVQRIKEIQKADAWAWRNKPALSEPYVGDYTLPKREYVRFVKSLIPVVRDIIKSEKILSETEFSTKAKAAHNIPYQKSLIEVRIAEARRERKPELEKLLINRLDYETKLRAFCRSMLQRDSLFIALDFDLQERLVDLAVDESKQMLFAIDEMKTKYGPDENGFMHFNFKRRVERYDSRIVNAALGIGSDWTFAFRAFDHLFMRKEDLRFTYKGKEILKDLGSVLTAVNLIQEDYNKTPSAYDAEFIENFPAMARQLIENIKQKELGPGYDPLTHWGNPNDEITK